MGCLLEVAGDELGHLEHADRLLAVEDGLKFVVRIDLGSHLFVLETIFLNVVPEFLGELSARQWFRTHNRRKGVVGLNRFQEGSVGFAFSHIGVEQ